MTTIADIHFTMMLVFCISLLNLGLSIACLFGLMQVFRYQKIIQKANAANEILFQRAVIYGKAKNPEGSTIFKSNWRKG